MPRDEHPGPTVDLRREEDRPVRKVLLDDLVAERKAPLPAAPVFTVDVVAVDEEAGRRKRRPREGEEPARQNARAAAEARAVAAGLHRTLEQEVLERRKVEREVVELGREVRRLAAAEERLAAAARSRLRQSTRGVDAGAVPRPARDCERHSEEITSLERALADQQELVDEYRERARSGLRERDAALMEARRAQAAREQAERHLELVSESLKRNAMDERARLDAAEAATTAAIAERDHLSEEIAELASGTSRLEQLTTHAEVLAARVTELEAALLEEDARAKATEIDLDEAREAVASLQAERTAVRDEAAVLADTLAAEREAAEALRVQMTELETELSGARAAMRAVGETAATAARDADELHAECDRLVARINVGEAELADARAAITTERERVAELERRNSELGNELEDSRARVAALEASVGAAGEGEAELLARVADFEQRLATGSATLADVEQRLAEELAARADAARSWEGVGAERDAARARVELLEQNLAVTLVELDAASARAGILELEQGDLRARLVEAEASAAATVAAATGAEELLVELARVAEVQRDATVVGPAGDDGTSDPELAADHATAGVAPASADLTIDVTAAGDPDGRRSALAQLTALAADTPGPLRQT